MLNKHDLELFKQIAMSFVSRGKWSWTRGELRSRVAASGMCADWERSLETLCRHGWMEALPRDVYRLNEQGKVEANKMIGPLAAGDM